MRHPIAAGLVAAILSACLSESDQPTTGKPIPDVTDAAADTSKPEPSCEETACAHVADCSPVLTGGVDWRTPESCLALGWTCYEPEACLAAVAALPCLPDDRPPTDAELDANTRAFVAVRAACIGPPY